MSTLSDWITAVCGELGIEESQVDQRRILDLARDVAHQVDRPAAPLTAFLAGLAVGRGRPLGQTTDRLTALAADWDSSHSAG